MARLTFSQLGTFNACLNEGIFPSRWKEATLELITKEKGYSESPLAYGLILWHVDATGKQMNGAYGFSLMLDPIRTSNLDQKENTYLAFHVETKPMDK